MIMMMMKMKLKIINCIVTGYCQMGMLNMANYKIEHAGSRLPAFPHVGWVICTSTRMRSSMSRYACGVVRVDTHREREREGEELL